MRRYGKIESGWASFWLRSGSGELHWSSEAFHGSRKIARNLRPEWLQCERLKMPFDLAFEV
jgi:hypothetical protein